MGRRLTHLKNQNFERGCTFNWLTTERFQTQGQPDVFNLHRLTLERTCAMTPVSASAEGRGDRPMSMYINFLGGFVFIFVYHLVFCDQSDENMEAIWVYWRSLRQK